MTKSPIFIGGAGRSGTTLLRVILDSHPNIACGPELKITPSIADFLCRCQTSYYDVMQAYLLDHQEVNKIFRTFMMSFLEKYRLQSGKPRIAEKSPNNIFVFQVLHELFPESPLIHVIRDGRDVVSSLLQMNWVNKATGKPIDITYDAEKAAAYWVNAIQHSMQIAKKLKKVYYVVQYEELITQPESVLKKLFTFIDEPWDPRVLAFHQQHHDLAGESSASQVVKPLTNTSVGRWKMDLTPEQQKQVKTIAGDTLQALGYTEKDPW